LIRANAHLEAPSLAPSNEIGLELRAFLGAAVVMSDRKIRDYVHVAALW
jgi:hypothetical protein